MQQIMEDIDVTNCTKLLAATPKRRIDVQEDVCRSASRTSHYNGMIGSTEFLTMTLIKRLYVQEDV